MNLPLRTRVDLKTDIRTAVDCRMLFLGDRIRLLGRTYEEIVRRFKLIGDSEHLFRSLQSSDEIKQFYDVHKVNGVTSVTMRDSVFREPGPLEDLKIQLRFRLDSNHFTCPLPMEKMRALGNLLPLLRKNLAETQIRESLHQSLNSEDLDWAMNLLSLLIQKGFATEFSFPGNHFHMDQPASRLTFMGHSSLLFQSQKAAILTDPNLRLDDGVPEYGMDVSRFKLNAIVCSHSHWDHCDLQSFLWFDKDTLLIVPKVKEATAFNPPIIQPLQSLGFRNFLEAELWKPIQIEDVELVPLPFHGEQDEPGAKMDHFTYVLRTGDMSIYAGVDSCRDSFGEMIPVLEKVREEYHPLMAFLPISGVFFRYEWGGAHGFCRYLDTNLVNEAFQYTASVEDAANCVKALKPKWVSPYAMFNFAPWSTPYQVPDFLKALREADLENHLYPLRPFQHLEASDFSSAREVRRRKLVRWFQIGAATRRFDRRMQQNRIYRYLRYRFMPPEKGSEHH